jgi:hypothetical protein
MVIEALYVFSAKKERELDVVFDAVGRGSTGIFRDTGVVVVLFLREKEVDFGPRSIGGLGHNEYHTIPEIEY